MYNEYAVALSGYACALDAQFVSAFRTLWEGRAEGNGLDFHTPKVDHMTENYKAAAASLCNALRVLSDMQITRLIYILP